MFGGFRTSLLVCRGFLRRNNINPQDIDTIISKYFTIDRVTIKENKKNKVVRCVGFRKSMIAFDTNLFNLVNNGNYNGTNTINVEIKVLNNECEERQKHSYKRSRYQKSQFLIPEIGIISIANQLSKSKKQAILSDWYEAIEDGTIETFVQMNNIINNEYNFTNFEKQYKSYFLQWSYGVPQWGTNTAGTLIRFVKTNDSNVVDTINYTQHSSHRLGSYSSRVGNYKSNKSCDKSLNEKYNISLGDSLCFRIEKNWNKNDPNGKKMNKYTMYFAKNGKFKDYFGKELVSQHKNENINRNISKHGWCDNSDFKNGRISLNFNKYTYYFAMLVPRCDCKYTIGFKCQISVK